MKLLACYSKDDWDLNSLASRLKVGKKILGMISLSERLDLSLVSHISEVTASVVTDGVLMVEFEVTPYETPYGQILSKVLSAELRPSLRCEVVHDSHGKCVMVELISVDITI